MAHAAAEIVPPIREFSIAELASKSAVDESREPDLGTVLGVLCLLCCAVERARPACCKQYGVSELSLEQEKALRKLVYSYLADYVAFDETFAEHTRQMFHELSDGT